MLERCGLSHREAAAFLRVRLDTVRSWSSGRNRVPPGVTASLRALYVRVERHADALAGADASASLLAQSATDAEAERAGLPSAGPLLASLGLLAVRAPP